VDATIQFGSSAPAQVTIYNDNYQAVAFTHLNASLGTVPAACQGTYDRGDGTMIPWVSVITNPVPTTVVPLRGSVTLNSTVYVAFGNDPLHDQTACIGQVIPVTVTVS